jgi:hypothetical protein
VTRDPDGFPSDPLQFVRDPRQPTAEMSGPALDEPLPPPLEDSGRSGLCLWVAAAVVLACVGVAAWVVLR